VDHAVGNRDHRAAARTADVARNIPRVGHWAEAIIGAGRTEGKLVHVVLADAGAAQRPQAGGNGRIVPGGRGVLQHPGPTGGGHAGNVDVVLDRKDRSGQRAGGGRCNVRGRRIETDEGVPTPRMAGNTLARGAHATGGAVARQFGEARLQPAGHWPAFGLDQASSGQVEKAGRAAAKRGSVRSVTMALSASAVVTCSQSRSRRSGGTPARSSRVAIVAGALTGADMQPPSVGRSAQQGRSRAKLQAHKPHVPTSRFSMGRGVSPAVRAVYGRPISTASASTARSTGRIELSGRMTNISKGCIS